MSFEKFITALHDCCPEVTVEEIKDALWLALQVSSLVSQKSSSQKSKSMQPESSPLNSSSDSLTSPISSTSPVSEKIPIREYPVFSRSDRHKNRLPIRISSARLLPHARQLAKSLRPLLKKIPSRTVWQLDEIATVKQVAETQVWLPVLRGVPERLFDGLLLIEDSESMRVWQPVLEELRHLLEHHGAFRRLQVWKFQEVGGQLSMRTYASVGNPQPLNAVIDLTRPRLILVISDAVSDGWYSGSVLKNLHHWSRYHPVALLHLLPQTMWSGTGLRQGLRVNLRSKLPYQLNAQLEDDAAEFWLEEDIPKGLKLPVATLEPRMLGYWAKLMAGQGQWWIPGVLFQPNFQKSTVAHPSESTEVTGGRVARFLSLASPKAQQLALYLVEVAPQPVTLEVMRLIQEVMAPESEQVHLAEVFLGGVLQPVGKAGEYDFYPEFREYEFKEKLAQRLDVKLGAEEVEKRVSDFVSQRFGQPWDFKAWLAAPDDKQGAFAKLAGETLRYFGGIYPDWAKSIDCIAQAEIIEFEVVTVDQRGRTISERRTNRQLSFELGKGVQLELMYIPAGEFMMGSPETEKGHYDDEGPQHKVKIASPFWMGKYPITQAQYEAIMGKNPSHFKGAQRPVENVSWDDCNEFRKRLSKRLGVEFKLPSEAQWEYACRAGTTTAYSFGDEASQLGNYAWYTENSGGETHPVGEKKPNAWGLYDMHGNVWEWCEDLWHSNYQGAPTDGSAWMSGGTSDAHPLRGGSWSLYDNGLRCAYRNWSSTTFRDFDRGLRLSRM